MEQERPVESFSRGKSERRRERSVVERSRGFDIPKQAIAQRSPDPNLSPADSGRFFSIEAWPENGVDPGRSGHRRRGMKSVFMKEKDRRTPKRGAIILRRKSPRR